MDRQKMLQQLDDVAQWDIIVIGGGATGLGCAVDAASRGYKTLLVEQDDFSKGTSSRSTKLVHGGVRYLAQGNIKLVKEALRERGILLKNAPHVCHNLAFIIPSFHWWQKWYYSIGLSMYDLLAGKLSLGKTKMLSKKTTMQLLPAISPDNLSGGVLYQDGQFDDARLAVNLAQTAVEQGAAMLNYCKVIALNKTGGNISGLVVEDVLSGIKYTLNGKSVINATGVFTDNVIAMDDAGHEPIVSPSQGVHIVVDEKFFPGKQALMIPKTDDGRVLFAVPWHDKVLLGTTDTPVKEITTEPKALQEEVDFIIKHCNRYLSTQIGHGDIKAVYAGLRPLIKVKGQKSTAILPRDHTTIVSKSGLVTITGGKWTTYRTMAIHAIDNAANACKLPKQPCVTDTLKIHGYTQHATSDATLNIYGSDAEKIIELSNQQPSLKEKIHAGLPYSNATVVWAVQHEMAMTVEDVLARRTRALFLDAAAAVEAAPMVAALIAGLLQRDDNWQQQQVSAFTAIAQNYLAH
ncbi:MAG: FAD-dependent oxidoreductase [Ferruginibacter sp.]|uniref:glycerol-3-phosphate dehydrogenase/oxidase n=1 Tax=Ferruginibacter sp. TaxID=1940288 RepID=UPI00265AD411|nr:glycerol-3-phosphate dehydrogenase/oxidase [Ferruginibacter sp.]MDB5278876.1 FAD-dependent oxidoreductase [Ferruginibacter sp.]